ncbi:hypothetical protein HOY82DRAFT_539193 [Tuber indicum]|nr:hypothetical protein HOY82DRAFT_539193 [Tuber indicum]
MPCLHSTTSGTAFIRTTEFSPTWYRGTILSYYGTIVGLPDETIVRCANVAYIWRLNLERFKDLYDSVLCHLEDAYLKAEDFAAFQFQVMGSFAHHPITQWMDALRNQDDLDAPVSMKFFNLVYQSPSSGCSYTLKTMIDALQSSVISISQYIHCALILLQDLRQHTDYAARMGPQFPLIRQLEESLDWCLREFERVL